MGQIIGGAAKPKRCNISKLSQLGTPAAGEHILVSSDNSMNAAGQGNFDCYIMGDGTTAATALPLMKINEIENDIIEQHIFSLAWTDNLLLRSNGGVTTISSGASQYNRCAATDKVACSDYQGKIISITHGGAGTGYTNIIFYSGNSGIASSYAELSGNNTDNISVPSNATSFRLGVLTSETSQLLGAKSTASASYTNFLLVKKTDIVDNLTTNDAAKVLSAKQGKLLKDNADAMQADIDALETELGNFQVKDYFTLAWTDNRILVSNGGVSTINSGDAQYNRCSVTDQVACSDYQGKKIKYTYGVIAEDLTRFIFYAGNTGLSDTYIEHSGSGTVEVVVPSNATSFRMCVYVAYGGVLADSKAAATAWHEEFSLLKKSDIADNLTTDDATKVLSAKQGKVLNNELTDVSAEVETLKDLIVDNETITFECAWTDNLLLRSNGGITTITASDTGYYGKCAVTDPVTCAEYDGKELTISHGIEGTTDMTYLAFYNSNGNLIGTAYIEFQGKGVSTETIPANTAYFRLGVRTNLDTNLTSMKAAAIASVIIPKEKKVGVPSDIFSQQLFGAIDYAMPTDFDYAQLLFFGQSFAQGGSSKVVDTGVIPNCYMFGNQLKALTGTAFNPLQLRTDVSEPYEYPVVSCSNALSRMYRRYCHDINIVASTAGTSGVAIRSLISGYIPNVQTMHTNMKAVADAENKTVGCFAIVYMQGESDYGGREDSTPDKATYKGYLLQVKNALQASAMNNLGQSRKPLFFIYQTSGAGWVKDYTGIDNSELGVSMAQIEFAQENDDVILISPAYQVTTYTDNHPSTNGYRWLGEMYAKAIWQTMYRGWRFSNPIPRDFVKEDKRIIIYISSCILPLRFNTWTLPRQTNYGFKVVADGTEVAITSISIENNAIILELGASISSATSVELTYGGVGVGKGNICDSDEWCTWFKYLSDANDDGYDGNRTIGQSPTAEGGGSLVGKDYPMNNFLCIFYKEFQSN